MTARYQIHRHVLNASYVRSSALWDLTNFNQPLGNIPNAIIRANERGPCRSTRHFIGARNRAGRFPRLSSMDSETAKQVYLPFRGEMYKAQVGVRVFNLLNHNKPRDLQCNTPGFRFGTFLNGADRMMRGSSSWSSET